MITCTFYLILTWHTFETMVQFCILCISVLVIGSNILVSAKFFQDILENYEKELLPTWNLSIPLEIHFDSAPGTLISFVEVEEKIGITMTLIMNWTDTRLTWIPKDKYDNFIIVTTKEIWLPYVYHMDSVDGIKPVGYDSHFYVIITAQGQVRWSPGDIFQSKCNTDVSKFPFDSHSCKLRFMMWISVPGKVEFTVESEYPKMKYFFPNSDWSVTKIRQSISKMDFPIYIVEIYFKRQPLYYVVTVILPTLMFSLMNPLVFCLPVESGERISLGMTILLAYTIFLTIVAASIPAKSNPICVLILVLVLIMLVSAIIVIFVIITAHFYHKENINEVNPCLKWLSICCQPQSNTYECEGRNTQRLSGKSVSKGLDIIFAALSYFLLVVILSTYFIYVMS